MTLWLGGSLCVSIEGQMLNLKVFQLQCSESWLINHSELNYMRKKQICFIYCSCCWINNITSNNNKNLEINLMFVDPCIIVRFIKKNPARCNNVSTFYYSLVIWSSTLCLTTPTNYTSNNLPRYKKTIGCQGSFRLLMMDGASPETCWASYKYGIIKFWYIVASCWIFLYEFPTWNKTLSYEWNLSRHFLKCSFCNGTAVFTKFASAVSRYSQNARKP
jgi:hypothetical protein